MLPNELLISQQARDLGNQLIKEMNINRSYGLANFLGVNTCYDNEPYRVCRRPLFLRECPDEKSKIHP